MSLPTIIANLRTAMRTISGLARVYDDPPESINDFPSAIVFAGRGEMSVVSDGLARNFHTILIQIYHSRQVLPEAIDAAKVWPDRVQAALNADQTLGGSVAHVVWPLRYTAGPIRYAADEAPKYGVSFELQVKQQGPI
jgi:hypothetical protein